MNILDKTRLLQTSILTGLIMGLGGVAYAQVEQTPVPLEDEFEEDNGGEIVVTGSRLKKDSFSSVSPLQIIDAEVERDLGLIDAAQILQNVTVAAGTQIDTSFGGFVLDNGPGSETVDLRGLGANRNLVLLNGRRVAPSGIEGAPSSPDIGLLPSGLIGNFDIVLDGASATYGSDAIAGVVNAVLRTDFEGFEVRGSAVVPDQITNGEEVNVNATWGKNTDRGYIIAGASYQYLDEIRLQDRDFTNNCNTNLEVTESGEFRTVDLSSTIGQRPDECKIQGLAGRIIAPGFGSIYTTGTGAPGNLTIPGFSESSLFGIGVDGDGDGVTDVTFQDFAINGRDLFASLRAEVERFSIASFGEYTFEGKNNITPFFEVVYSGRETFQDSGAFQLFPQVPANNPFNPCNPAAEGGVDCGIAFDNLLRDPNFASAVQANFGLTPQQFADFGIVDLFSGPIGAAGTQIVASVRGDRTQTFADITQLRLVGGVKGDIPQINFGDVSNWSGEIYGSYSESNGSARRPGIRDDRLDFALGVGADGVPCTAPDGVTVPSSVSAGCVPVDLFANSLYNGVVGDFATQAERDYLFDDRDFDTEVKQTIFNAFMQGDVLELPAGTVTLGFGGEIRIDEINSVPDDVAGEGLFFGFFSDLGAVGEKTTKEAFAEIDIPILADHPLANRLNFQASGRITKDEFYPTAGTYSLKGEYQPVDFLTLRATLGTSYRAPNLRENFLLTQTGFGNFVDPCLAPDLDTDPITGEIVGQDPRSQQTLDNCRAAGLDPTTFGAGGTGVVNAEIGRGGALDLLPEESTSFTAGFAFDQPFTEAFDLSIGATYFDIDIENTVIEPGGQFLINECFVQVPGLASPFCSRIQRDAGGNIDFIDGGFINRDRETAEGVDVNVRYNQDLTIFGKPVEFGINANGTRLIERNTIQSLGDGIIEVNEFVGEFAFPKWRGLATARAEYNDFSLLWQTSYLGAVRADEDVIADDIFAFANQTVDGAGVGNSQTCLGPDAGDELCRNVNTAGDYFLHNVSLTYRADSFSIGFGVRNVFDREPPRIDTASVFGTNNVPLGAGYDLNGRRVFANFTKTF